MKTISKGINSQLRSEGILKYYIIEKTRQGLEQYFDSGIDALKKTNDVIKDILKERSLFGCNICAVLGVAIMVILILTLF